MSELSAQLRLKPIKENVINRKFNVFDVECGNQFIPRVRQDF